MRIPLAWWGSGVGTDLTRVLDRFPDGQLYLNLRGFGPEEPLTPPVALARLLRSVGVPGSAVPDDVEARSALLRSTLAGRRMLMVLDNARDTAQVRPLLPGAGTVLLVTSRDQLRGLAIREGAHSLGLRELSTGESTALLRVALPDVSPGHDGLLHELAELCGHLPLALAVAAERLRYEPERDLRALLDELRDEQTRLPRLESDDVDSDLRAVFSWSYRAWPHELARLFRLLALQPGADIGVPAAAALAGTTEAEASALLEALADAHQLQRKLAGRYEQHDLVRAYGRELAATADEPDDRERAVLRLAVWYLATVRTARDRLVNRTTTLDPPLPHPPAPDPLDFLDPQGAAQWYDLELVNLVDVMRHLAEHAPVGLAGQFPASLWGYFNLRSDWKNWEDSYGIGLEDARRAGDGWNEAWMLNGLSKFWPSVAPKRSPVSAASGTPAVFCVSA